MSNGPGDYEVDDGNVYYGDSSVIWYDDDGDQHCEYYDSEEQ